MTLPPGQHRVDGFPRFGTHLHKPPPRIPTEPSIEVRGAVHEPVRLSLQDLAAMPRREITADFHCVAGWSATGLRWEGVPFAEFYRLVIEPVLDPQSSKPAYFAFHGLDRYHSLAHIDDALADDVLIAQHLDGQPLTPDHGAPLRLVSPSQYGFVSCKHLCAVEVLTNEPDENFGAAPGKGRSLMMRPLFDRHPRSRVWYEERNRTLPNWLLRPVYRWVLAPPLHALCALGARDSRE